MKNFFERNPSVAQAAPAEAAGGLLDAQGQSQVKELTSLMSEAEEAWNRAQQLTAVSGEERK